MARERELTYIAHPRLVSIMSAGCSTEYHNVTFSRVYDCVFTLSPGHQPCDWSRLRAGTVGVVDVKLRAMSPDALALWPMLWAPELTALSSLDDVLAWQNALQVFNTEKKKECSRIS